MSFSRLYQVFLIHILIFPLFAAVFDHHLYERLPYSQPFYLQAGQLVHLYQLPYHHDGGEAPIFGTRKGAVTFTEVQPELSTLTFNSRQSLPSRKAVFPGLMVVVELSLSPLDQVNSLTDGLREEILVGNLSSFIRPPEKPPRG